MKLEEYLDKLRAAIADCKDLNAEFGLYGDNDFVLLGENFNINIRRLLRERIWKPDKQTKKQVGEYLKWRDKRYEDYQNAQDDPDITRLREWKGEIRIPDEPVVFVYDSHTRCQLDPINDINCRSKYYQNPPFDTYKTLIFITGAYFSKDKHQISHSLLTGKTVLALGEFALQRQIPIAVGKLTLESYLHLDFEN